MPLPTYIAAPELLLQTFEHHNEQLPSIKINLHTAKRENHAPRPCGGVWSTKSSHFNQSPYSRHFPESHLPEGRRSAMNGTLSDTLCQSSRVSWMPTDLAMAMRCSTAFVDPPTCTPHALIRDPKHSSATDRTQPKTSTARQLCTGSLHHARDLLVSVTCPKALIRLSAMAFYLHLAK